MAILRPLAVEAAIAFRQSVDFMLEAITDSIEDDFCFPAKHMPVVAPVFVPCREGKSLLSFVKRRSIFKRRTQARWSDL